MSLAEIMNAVHELSPEELAELIAFVRQRDSAAWDKQLEEDAASGKLDFLFEEAEQERAGQNIEATPELLAAIDEADAYFAKEGGVDLAEARCILTRIRL